MSKKLTGDSTAYHRICEKEGQSGSFLLYFFIVNHLDG